MADLEATDLVKEFPTRGEPLRVLRGVSLSLDRGDNVAVVGPSGSGKSTLLHVLGGLDPPTSGQVRLEGVDPFALDQIALAAFRNERVGFIFQEHHLLPQLSVLENVLLPALSHGSPSPDAARRAAELVEQVGLAERRDHRPAELSGGERQRAAVARALLHKPSLVLADEPTGSLDQANAASVAQLLVKLQQQQNSMLVVVTHSQELAAMMQRRLEFRDGQLHPS